MAVSLAAPTETGRIFAELQQGREQLAAMDDDVVATQVELSEIPAPTHDERRRGRDVAARMRRLGLTVTVDDTVGNVIGRRAGASDEAPVVVCAHLDTVFAADTDVRVRREGSRLVGPGIGDNARGLAAMLALARVIDGASLRTMRPIDFIASVGEEALGDLRGAKHHFANGGRDAAAAIILDGPGDERVVHRAVGSRRMRIRFTGPGGHSWSAYGLPNPLNAAGTVAARVARINIPVTPRTALTVARISGGLAINAIPGEAIVELDLRSVSQAVVERIASEIAAIVRAALAEENERRARGTPPLAVALESLGERPAGETPADDPLVVAALEATRLVGREPEAGAASTDANVPISLGIPAIALGGGGHGGDAHTPGEWFENVEGTLGLARALTIVCAAARLAHR
ncbi:MAG TPA: M20/M25/M40 family metallo-hydrolase [Gemmatimonadaceae bacterium]|nr:M20/M25/M40 family metallo-hydrolase [Gemmatimonadaceae bacterium]